jgi:hypothetical protein
MENLDIWVEIKNRDLCLVKQKFEENLYEGVPYSSCIPQPYPCDTLDIHVRPLWRLQGARESGRKVSGGRVRRKYIERGRVKREKVYVMIVVESLKYLGLFISFIWVIF